MQNGVRTGAFLRAKGDFCRRKGHASIMSVQGLHHIQLAIPAGGEALARAFFAILGFVEVGKPAALAGRGGAWFRAGAAELHLGVQDPFAPAQKAHPAFEVTDLADLKTRLKAAGIDWQSDADLPGLTRIFVTDPFGNRIELVQRTDG